MIVLVGNHEAMNMTGDLRYVHPGEYARLRRPAISEARRDASTRPTARRSRPPIKRHAIPQMTAEAIRDAWMKATPLGMLEHQRAWAPDGEIGKWVVGKPAVVKLGDTLFVHGGISAAYAAVVARADQPPGRRRAEGRGTTAPTSIINDPIGPLWYRGLITRGAG